MCGDGLVGSQNRSDRSGLGNYELRFSNAGQAIGEARRKNRLHNWPIVVEGPRDKRALVALGFTGPVEVLNRGWPIERVVAHLYETYGTRNEAAGGASVCLMMDWDRTGGRLQRKLAGLMQSFDMMVDEETRTILQKNLKPETRIVESLYGMADRLNFHITQEDRL